MTDLKGYLFFISILMLQVACASKATVSQESIVAGKVQDNIILREPQLMRFASPGPFLVSSRVDKEFNLDLNQTVVVDHFYARSQDKLPVIVISHGNFSNKRAHREQAKHLASWGFHVITVESPNRDEWLQNGERLRDLVEIIHSFPKILGDNADPSRILMVGHSFGGSAAIVAIGDGAPVIGAILLDPAVVHSKVIASMKKSDVPVALLGSDQKVFYARGSSRFLKNIAGEILEVSVPKATHDYAQGPSVFSQAALGVDPFTSTAKQAIFRSMLTASVLGVASSGTLDFSVRVFTKAAKSGVLADLVYRQGL